MLNVSLSKTRYVFTISINDTIILCTFVHWVHVNTDKYHHNKLVTGSGSPHEHDAADIYRIVTNNSVTRKTSFVTGVFKSFFFFFANGLLKIQI